MVYHIVYNIVYNINTYSIKIINYDKKSIFLHCNKQKYQNHHFWTQYPIRFNHRPVHDAHKAGIDENKDFTGIWTENGKSEE